MCLTKGRVESILTNSGAEYLGEVIKTVKW